MRLKNKYLTFFIAKLLALVWNIIFPYMNVSSTGLSLPLIYYIILAAIYLFNYLVRKVLIINLVSQFVISFCYYHPFILLHEIYQFITFLPKTQIIIEIPFSLHTNLSRTNIYKLLSLSITPLRCHWTLFSSKIDGTHGMDTLFSSLPSPFPSPYNP